MKYEILTEVVYRHTFFPGHGYEGIRLHIPAAAASYLSQQGLLLKQRPGGFALLYAAEQAGKHRSRETVLTAANTLLLDLVLTDHLFYNYTQVNVQDITGSIFFFSNQAPAAAGTLHRLDYVSAQDLLPVSTLQETFFRKPFGRIALVVNGQLQPYYQLRFPARAVRWCYFLMSEGLQSLSNPAVISTNGNGYFGMPQRVSLPGKGEVPVFISTDPLPLGDNNNPVFQLVDYSSAGNDRYKVIMPALPAPETGRVSNAAATLYEEGSEYAEIFLY